MDQYWSMNERFSNHFHVCQLIHASNQACDVVATSPNMGNVIDDVSENSSLMGSLTLDRPSQEHEV
jgi:hypothetical protein